MTISQRVEIAAALAREAWRAITTPFLLALYLLQQRYWRARAHEAISSSTDHDPFAGIEAACKKLLAKRPPHANRSGHVFLSVGEASGVGHGRGLARAVLRSCDEQGIDRPRFTVFGGPDLVASIGDKAELAYPLSEHPQIGIVDVVRNLGFFVRAHARFVKLLDETPPDVVVLVDYPGMHFVMARAAQARRIPVIHYVAPQYWAWGPWRLARYRNAVDATLTIFPFEPHFFAGGDTRLASAYVGHPLVDARDQNPPDPTKVAQAASEPTLVVLPGARRRELAWHLEGMLHLVADLREKAGPLRCVIVQRNALAAERTRTALADLPENAAGGPVEVVQDEPGPWFRGARAVLAKSGTASLEACVHGAVTVILYRVDGWFFRFVYRHLLTVSMFGGANLAVGREIAPEFAIVENEDWARCGVALQAAWFDGPVRTRAQSDLSELEARLGGPGASERAARFVVPYCASATTANESSRSAVRSPASEL